MAEFSILHAFFEKRNQKTQKPNKSYKRLILVDLKVLAPSVVGRLTKITINLIQNYCVPTQPVECTWITVTAIFKPLSPEFYSKHCWSDQLNCPTNLPFHRHQVNCVVSSYSQNQWCVLPNV